MYKACLSGAACVLFTALSMPSQAASVSYDLTVTNDGTGNIPSGTPYARVVIDDNAGLINFTVTILNSDLTDNKGTNFGLQSFGFNVVTPGAADGLQAVDIINAPAGWISSVDLDNLAQNGMGKFDATVSDGGQFRVDPALTFSINLPGDSISDYIDGSSKGYFFSAHITGFNDLNPLPPADDPNDGTGLCYDTTGQGDFTAECNFLTSVWVAGSTPTVIPVPAAVWLFGSGLLGLVGVARRKKVSA